MRKTALLVTILGSVLASGCVSYSRTEKTVPAPATTTTTPPVQRTVYPDGSYVDRPVQ